jgi:hypothetical protein
MAGAVCESLVELCGSMRRFAFAFDPSTLSGVEADSVVAEAGALERMAAAVKGLAAAQRAGEGMWKATGDRSAAHHLSRITGTSVGRAGEILDTARRLSALPVAAAAARAGELSAEQAAAVTRAASADPASESRLVGVARSASLSELREECGRVRDLIETGDPFLAAVVTKGEQVVGVAHLGRRASAGQQTALEWLFPTCAVLGCGATAFLENDHRVDWAASHRTVFDLLDRLCSHHHDLKTIDNWALVAGHGKRAFVPPDDRRHPRHAPPAAA